LTFWKLARCWRSRYLRSSFG